MAKLAKPIIEIVPVSWHDGEVLKYQAKVTLVRPNDDVKVLTGDPMNTKQAAFDSLCTEVSQRQEDLARIVSVIQDYQL